MDGCSSIGVALQDAGVRRRPPGDGGGSLPTARGAGWRRPSGGPRWKVTEQRVLWSAGVGGES
jgi:hypothetical protein